MPGERVLVVDDNAINLRLAWLLLANDGYEVRAAQNAEEALALVQIFRPRLILMDLQLPGMDGFELTRLLKGRPDTRDIRVIAVTSYAMKGDRERALGAGCDGYVTKPIDTDHLARLIAETLAKGGQRQ